ncbi:MAG: amidohydrolase [Magnetococcales bacterium]|nr:amidohydrolase [Magnetococcales bacterium]
MTLCIHNAMLEGYASPVSLLVTDGLIERIDPRGARVDQAQCLDARGMTLLPGLVNAHTHAAMTLLRGAGDDMPLMTWLQEKIWPAEARLTEVDVYWGTRLACLEMIRSGTTAFHDGYWHFHAVARAVRDSGMKAAIGLPIVDALGADQGEACKNTAQSVMQEIDRYDPRWIRPVIYPHAIYSVSTETLRWCQRFAEIHDLTLHIHLSETRDEVDRCLKQHGMRPVFYLDSLGLLHQRTILAHAIFLDDAELDLIAERKTTLVTNPTSNLKLACGGVFPYERMAKRSIAMGMGTDGAASNNSLDMFQEMKLFSLMQKHTLGDPTALPAQVALQIAMGCHAPILGHSGIIAPGEPADLILINTHTPEMTPPLNLHSNLVYAATGHVVDTTIIHGRIVMQNRIIADEDHILDEVTKRSLALTRHDHST